MNQLGVEAFRVFGVEFLALFPISPFFFIFSYQETESIESLIVFSTVGSPEEEVKPLKEEKAERIPTPKKPWLTLVSYVDELTVGGRRDSKGRYIDGMGSFPGFGRNAKNRTPQDCFPMHCYQRSAKYFHTLNVNEEDVKYRFCRLHFFYKFYRHM